MHLATLALLVALHGGLTPTTAITYWSDYYGVPTEYALKVAYQESQLENQWGDNGDAYGIWQWHKQSIDTVVEHMIANGEIERDDIDFRDGDIRADYWISTRCAMYAMSEMGLYRWWSADKQFQHLR